MTLTKKSLLFVMILLALACAPAARAQGKSKASLLISYMEGDGGDVQHVERLDFVDGELASRKRVVTLNHDSDGYAGDVVNSRYLRTVYRNKIYDLREGQFLPESRFKSVPSAPLESDKPGLPGLLSPDGTKSVDAGGFFVTSTDKLEIHFAGRPAVVVRDNFQITWPERSSFAPRFPLLWVDNDRILTQQSNGNLVIVSTDGSVLPFLQIPCKSSGYAALVRNRSDKIVYECGGNYFIDVENRRYEEIKDDLGYGFEADSASRDRVYYYKGVEIGRNGLDPVTTKSYVAVLYGEAKDGVIDAADIKTVKVWNETKRDWSTLTVGGWGARIVGWIEE